MRTGTVGKCGRRAAAAGLATVCAVGVVACGGSGPKTSTTSATTPASPTTSQSVTTSSSHAARPRPRRTGVPIGHAQLVHAGSSILSVTVTSVIDPLRDSGAALLPGTRAVGVRISIHNLHGETYDSTASGDVSVATSSGMPAPLFIKQGVCQTPLTDFESLIGVGETRAGCVGFTVPKTARIVAVRFSPHSRARGTVTWRPRAKSSVG